MCTHVQRSLVEQLAAAEGVEEGGLGSMAGEKVLRFRPWVCRDGSKTLGDGCEGCGRVKVAENGEEDLVCEMASSATAGSAAECAPERRSMVKESGCGRVGPIHP